jgi:hypothetical protein
MIYELFLGKLIPLTSANGLAKLLVNLLIIKYLEKNLS